MRCEYCNIIHKSEIEIYSYKRYHGNIIRWKWGCNNILHNHLIDNISYFNQIEYQQHVYVYDKKIIKKYMLFFDLDSTLIKDISKYIRTIFINILSMTYYKYDMTYHK